MHVGIDIEQFVRDPYGSGIQRGAAVPRARVAAGRPPGRLRRADGRRARPAAAYAGRRGAEHSVPASRAGNRCARCRPRPDRRARADSGEGRRPAVHLRRVAAAGGVVPAVRPAALRALRPLRADGDDRLRRAADDRARELPVPAGLVGLGERVLPAPGHGGCGRVHQRLVAGRHPRAAPTRSRSADHGRAPGRRPPRRAGAGRAGEARFRPSGHPGGAQAPGRDRRGLPRGRGLRRAGRRAALHRRGIRLG